MRLFRPYERNDNVAEKAGATAPRETPDEAHAGAATTRTAADAKAAKSTTAVPVEEIDAGSLVVTPVRKKVATPTRRAAEQARRERLHPTLSKKESKARERDVRMTKREEATKAVDAQPGRVLVRDFVDSKRHLAGYAMPAILGALLVSVVGGLTNSVIVMTVTSVLVWVVLAALLIDLFVSWRNYRKLHLERLPKVPLKGLLSYYVNRAINPRRLRMPAPRVKIGDTI